MNSKNNHVNANNKTRMADTVVLALESRIYAGKLKNGDIFPSERELTEEFSVSRTVAREAIKILAGKALIKAEPGYRPIVRQPNYQTALGMLGELVNLSLEKPDGVENLFQIRVFIETGLVRLAATNAKKEDITNMRKALERNEQCIQDSEMFYQTDMEFHAVFYTLLHNPIFPALHRSFCSWLEEYWKKMPRSPLRNRQNYHAHEAIFEAILSRDPDQAELTLREHLAASWEQVKPTFSDLPST